MNHTVLVQVSNGLNHYLNKMRSVTLKIASLLTYTVKQLSTQGQIRHQIHYGKKRLSDRAPTIIVRVETDPGLLTIIKSLKVIDQTEDIFVILRDSAKHIDLIANHVFTTFHQLLIDNLDGIVFTSINLRKRELV